MKYYLIQYIDYAPDNPKTHYRLVLAESEIKAIEKFKEKYPYIFHIDVLPTIE